MLPVADRHGQAPGRGGLRRLARDDGGAGRVRSDLRWAGLEPRVPCCGWPPRRPPSLLAHGHGWVRPALDTADPRLGQPRVRCTRARVGPGAQAVGGFGDIAERRMGRASPTRFMIPGLARDRREPHRPRPGARASTDKWPWRTAPVAPGPCRCDRGLILRTRKCWIWPPGRKARSRRSPTDRAQTKFRVENWPAYEAPLRRRGDITIWFDEAAVAAWNAPASGLPGGQRKYSDLAISTTLTLRTVYSLPLRQTEGFVASLIRLIGLALGTPTRSGWTTPPSLVGASRSRFRRSRLRLTVRSIS